MSKSLTTRNHEGIIEALRNSAAVDLRESALRVASAEVAVVTHSAALVEARQQAREDYPAVARWIAGNCQPKGNMPGVGSNGNDWRKWYMSELAAAGLSLDAAKQHVKRAIKVGLILAKFPDMPVSIVTAAVNAADRSQDVNDAYACANADDARAILDRKPVVKRKANPDGKGSKTPDSKGSKGNGDPVAASSPADRLAAMRGILAGKTDGWTAEDFRAMANGLATLASEVTATARRMDAAADAARDMASANA